MATGGNGWKGGTAHPSYLLLNRSVHTLMWEERKVRTERDGWEHIGKRARKGSALGETNDWVWVTNGMNLPQVEGAFISLETGCYVAVWNTESSMVQLPLSRSQKYQ